MTKRGGMITTQGGKVRGAFSLLAPLDQELTSRFAAVRVRCAHRVCNRAEPRPEESLLIEWPDGEAEPTNYFLSTLTAETPIRKLVRVVKLR